MVSKGFPDVVTSGQQFSMGEKPIVILYTYIINRHAGTPKPQSRDILLLTQAPIVVRLDGIFIVYYYYY